MSTTASQPSLECSFATEDQQWQAVVSRDRRADDRFFYSVESTGVYCRPSCAARLPNRGNVRFHLTTQAAERAGFRACKRCRPNEPALISHHAAAVEQACKLIEQANESPGLETLADAVGMSPSHFHRIFKSLTGVTPKAYATAQRSNRVRGELSRGASVTAAIQGAGFKSAGRFYASSPGILGMTPTTFRMGGKGAEIQFAVGECSLGSILVAASDVGVCLIALGDDPNALVQDLQDRFPKADLVAGDPGFEVLIAKVIGFVERPSAGLDLPLDVQGTAFQLRVWQLLREIPCGRTVTYTQLAQQMGEPKAVRAVAHACAANKLAVVIPCHRVVRTDGSLAGYRWGIDRKEKLLQRERAEG